MRMTLLALVLLGASGCNRVDPPAQDAAAPAAPAPMPAIVLAPLASAAASSVASSACNLESIADQQVVDSSPIQANTRDVGVSGWIVDESAEIAPERISLHARQLEGEGATWQAALPVSISRPDVQAARGGVAGLSNSGFQADLDASSLPAGRYALTLHFRNNAGADVVCDNGRTVDLK